MKIAMFSTHDFERSFFEDAAGPGHEIRFLQSRLSPATAEKALGCKVACCFVNDQLDVETLEQLKSFGVSLIALRSAGFNHLNVRAAHTLGLTCVYVPEYSPHAVAEFAVGLILSLNRKIHTAHLRVRDLRFSLDGLVGFDLKDKTIGVIGTGRIGKVFCKIMRGFGCQVIAYDSYPDSSWAHAHGVEYRSFQETLAVADILSLHIPLNPDTHHLFNSDVFSKMKSGALLINTSRGGIIHTEDLIQALESKKLGGAGLDVYEFEGPIFFRDQPRKDIYDPVLERLLNHETVLLTGHQAFLTKEALRKIAETTVQSIEAYEKGESLEHVTVPIREGGKIETSPRRNS